MGRYASVRTMVTTACLAPRRRHSSPEQQRGEKSDSSVLPVVNELKWASADSRSSGAHVFTAESCVWRLVAPLQPDGSRGDRVLTEHAHYLRTDAPMTRQLDQMWHHSGLLRLEAVVSGRSKS